MTNPRIRDMESNTRGMIEHISNGANYALKHGYRYTTRKGGWSNLDRVAIATAVAEGRLTVTQAANKIGCCRLSIKNWVKTLDQNNPRLG